MADNIDCLKSTGAQKYLNYDLIGSPFTVQGLASYELFEITKHLG